MKKTEKKYITRLVVGDIHGHGDIFKTVYERENPDEVIILGDYVDSYVKSPEEQEESLLTIVDIMENHKENKKGLFKMLLGNHDFHYILTSERYSGWNPRTFLLCKPIFSQLMDQNQLEPIYVDYVNKIIYSHAGLTQEWYDTKCLNSLEEIKTIALPAFKFTYGKHMDRYGNDPANGPLWVRPESLCKSLWKDSDGIEWDQIIGHTRSRQPFGFGPGDRWVTDYSDVDDFKFNQYKVHGLDTFPMWYLIQYLDHEGNLVASTYVKNMHYPDLMMQ